ncbi:MAG TPA: hypothetical protein VN682_28230 [Terriglobales bacterium]|nr:hypothetical protein [Terriglobales bacterium]
MSNWRVSGIRIGIVAQVGVIKKKAQLPALLKTVAQRCYKPLSLQHGFLRFQRY